MAVEPETSGDRKKLEDALGRLGRQDPTFKAKVSEETGQTLISGMGELHLEIIRERLHRDFNLNVRVHKPRVSYRETVTKMVRGEGEYSRVNGGETNYCQVRIRIEPTDGAETIAVKSELKFDALPAEVDRLINQAVQEAGPVGRPRRLPAAARPLRHRGGRLRSGTVDRGSDPGRVRHRGPERPQRRPDRAPRADHEARSRDPAGVPRQHPGGPQPASRPDRRQRARDHLTVLTAEAPLAKMFGYSTHVRSLSTGRASYSMEPLKYDLGAEGRPRRDARAVIFAVSDQPSAFRRRRREPIGSSRPVAGLSAGA